MDAPMLFNKESPKIVTLFLPSVSGLFFDECLSLFILFELSFIFILSSLLSECYNGRFFTLCFFL